MANMRKGIVLLLLAVTFAASVSVFAQNNARSQGYSAGWSAYTTKEHWTVLCRQAASNHGYDMETASNNGFVNGFAAGWLDKGNNKSYGTSL